MFCLLGDFESSSIVGCRHLGIFGGWSFAMRYKIRSLLRPATLSLLKKAMDTITDMVLNILKKSLNTPVGSMNMSKMKVGTIRLKNCAMAVSI